MKDKLRLFGCVIFIIFMTSGGVFQPQMVDMPLIDKKSEVRLDGGITLLTTAYATVTYAITDKIAIQAFGHGGGGISSVNHIQGAVGYFKDFGHKNILEWYFGYGYGHANFDYSTVLNNNNCSDTYGYGYYGSGYEGSYMYELPYYKLWSYQEYFTQINYGLIGFDFANMDFGFSLKAGYLYSDLSDYDFHGPAVDGNQLEHYTKNSILLEPLAFIRLGSKKLKFCLKVGDNWIYNLSRSDVSIPHARLNAGIGINYKF